MSLSLPQRRINIRLMDTRQAEIGDKIHFAVMAIEASAKEMSISPMEIVDVWKRSDWCVACCWIVMMSCTPKV